MATAPFDGPDASRPARRAVAARGAPLRPGPPADLGQVPWVTEIPEPRPPLAADLDADLAIVGGGFTGLATALSVLERFPRRRVVVLEAGVCGGGASGRNAGMALPGAGVDAEGLERRLGPAGARRAAGWLRRGLDRLLERARRLGFADAVEPAGSLALGRTARHRREQERLLAIHARLGEEAEILEGEALRRELSSPLYRSALHLPGGLALVDPWRVLQGMRRAALAAGAALYESTPVLSIADGAEIALACPGGRVRAGAVVLAMNAWSSRFAWFRGRIAPVHVACVATRPLAAGERAHLGWARRQALWEEGRVYHFLRLTPDDRVLMGGGGAVYRPHDGLEYPGAPAAYARLEAALAAIFPALRGVPITHRWSGPVAFARDFLPSFGSLGRGDRLLYAAGYAGHGVALSHLAGDVLCALYAGERHEVADLFLLDRRLPTLLPEPFRYVAVNAVRNGWLALDRLGL